MSKFRITTVEEVAENFDNIRVPLSSKQRKDIAKIYPYYGAQSIIDYVDDFLFDGEYILVAEDGENLKSQNNNVCNLVNGKFWVNNHAHIIRAKEGNNTKYLCYYLNLMNFKPFVTGSAQPKLTKDNLNSIPLKIHKKEEQKQIAKVLSDLDAKIEVNNKINQELEAMAKTLYDYWFVQFDFPDANGKPYKSSGGKMVFNEALKREIPEDWESGTILDCADLVGGGTPKKEIDDYWNGDIPFFTPTDTENNVFCLKTILYTNELGISKSSTKYFDQGTILITARGTVGKINIAGKPMAMNQSCYALVPKDNYNSEFIYFHTSQIVKYLKAKSSGSIFKAIVTNDFKFTPSIVPDEEIVLEYSKKVASMFEMILNNKKENQKLSELRDWLLPMLMNGQVTVGEVESELGMVAEGNVKYGE